MYFKVNFNVFFKFIKVHLLVSELYIYQNARYNDKKYFFLCLTFTLMYIIMNKSVSLHHAVKTCQCSEDFVLFSVDNFVNLTEVAFVRAPQ